MSESQAELPKEKSATRWNRGLSPEQAFGSNAIRLTLRQWLVVGVIVVGVCLGVSYAWRGVEAFEPGPDYRVPYDLSNDYWLCARYSDVASDRQKCLVIGDSVVWGEYVTPEDTLTHHLNRLVGGDRFVNLGVNGIHPVAMAGLISYYGRAIRGQDVVLHVNPLWMSSERHDLQASKEFRFNHPKLAPQFFPKIPCYREPYAERVGIVFERYLPFRAWANHLAIAYFDNLAPTMWLRENPYGNPFKEVTLELPAPSAELRHEPVPWTDSVGEPVAFDWVAPDTSLQWRSSQRTIETLLARKNRVFVIVGPFNEHMIKDESLEAYNTIKNTIALWLEDQGVPHCVPALLPSGLYADASHPLGEGYARLAGEILESDAFQDFAGDAGANLKIARRY